MITAAFCLGTITCAFWVALYTKLPKKLKAYLAKHSMATDLIASVLTYWFHAFFSGSATVLFAAAFVCLETSILLAIARDPQLSAFFAGLIKKINEWRSAAMKLIKSAVIDEPVNALPAAQI